MIAIDLSKQQALDADPRAIQQINFTANLDRNDGATLFFITEQATFTGDRKSFVNAIPLNTIPLNAKFSLIFISIKWHNTIV